MTADSEGGSETQRRTIPREQDAPRRLIVLLILLMLLAVAGIYAAVQRTQIGSHVLGRPATLAREGPLFTLQEILDEPEKGNLLGRDAAIWAVPVQRVTGDWLFWVGTAPDAAVPVVLLGEQTARQSELQTVVRTGDVVAVFGTVHALRDLALDEDAEVLQAAERERLSRAQVYISALRVEHISRR